MIHYPKTNITNNILFVNNYLLFIDKFFDGKNRFQVRTAVFSWKGRKNQDQLKKGAWPLFSLFRSRTRNIGKTTSEIRRIARFPGPK